MVSMLSLPSTNQLNINVVGFQELFCPTPSPGGLGQGWTIGSLAAVAEALKAGAS